MDIRTSKSSTPTFALGPLFISWGSGFFGRAGRVDGDSFGGAGLGGAELFLNVGGSGLFGLKRVGQKVTAIILLNDGMCQPLR